MNDDAGTSLEELQKVGIKDFPLIPIQYENIMMPLLHITMGLNFDINSKIKPLLNAVYEKRLITFYKKIRMRMRNYWELFSGNHVKKLMKNVDKYIATLPNSCEKMVNMKTILKYLSVVYHLVLKAVPDDKDKLREALNDLINAYKNGSYKQGQEALHSIINKDLFRLQSLPTIEKNDLIISFHSMRATFFDKE
uniref:Uncharacterized protein n=1 Tax=Rhabditophanes sp. KR3021 TaxID=114890 RepID=A0AC35UEN8_9BILA